jgi:D-alanine transaminase
VHVFFNGEFMPVEQARIPVLDRGFIFGDGIYEYIPAYSRIPFRLIEHLARLKSSLDAVRMDNPYSDARWGELIARVIAANPWNDQGVYLQVTRGVSPRDHAFPRDLRPTVLIMTGPLPTPSPAQVENGVAAVTSPDFRWLRCDIKSTSLLANCMLKTLAAESGCSEVILLRDGFLTEASASSVFVVAGDVVLAPPKSPLTLPGITCDVVLELLREHQVAHELRPIPEAELRAAQEIWLTSSSREVLAVTTLDGRPVGIGQSAGTPGPVFRRVHELYQRFKATLARPVDNEVPVK